MRMSRVARRFALAALLLVAGGAALAASGFGQSATGPVLTANRFVLEIEGRQIATFQELSGISSETEPADYYSTDEQKELVLSRLPGRVKPSTVTLKHGMTDSMELWAWHDAVRRGLLDSGRQDTTLVVYNSEGQPVARWFLEKAWPTKLEIGTLRSGSTQYMTESVTLVSEYITRLRSF